MTRRSAFFLGVLAIAGGLVVAVARARAEECSLALWRFDSPDESAHKIVPPSSYIARMARPQSFFTQLGSGKVVAKNQYEEAFRRIVKKEPAKYVAEQPFRGVAKLGDEEFAFVLDKSDAKQIAYDRLYFDANHNGDLTDDRRIDAKPAFAPMVAAGHASSEFPRIDVSFRVAGSKVDCAFRLSVYENCSGDFKYASCSITSAACRVGDIAVAGKRHHLLLMDFNSNGRFDDEPKVRDEVQMPDGQLYIEPGDLLFVDPGEKFESGYLGYSYVVANGNQISKLLSLDGKLYEMKISPSGDKLTLNPSSAPTGTVTGPLDGFRAVVRNGDYGFLNIACGKSSGAIVPAGKWKLTSYTIDQVAYGGLPAPGGAKPAAPAKTSILEGLLGALTGGLPARITPPGFGRSLVSCEATNASPVVTVREGKTVALPFGPPYKPIVKIDAVRSGPNGAVDKAQVSMQLSLVGSGGEVCNDMMVQGGRPSSPKFAILGPKDAVVDSGTFKYG